MSIPQDPTGFHDDIDETDYHAHPGSLSVSGAKVLLRAPSLFKHQQDNPVHKDVFDIGSAAHALVLGVGAPIEVIDSDSWRTKAAQEARDAARAKGKTPLLVADYTKVQAMADRLSSHKAAMRLLSAGKPEVSAFCRDEATGVMRRGRFDWLPETILVDYKTAATVDPRDLAGRYGAVSKWGYDNQAAWYIDLARDLGHPAQFFVFVFQSKEPPYEVVCARVDEDELYGARERNRTALQRFRDCTESGIWPGYVPDDVCLSLSLTNQTYTEELIA